jgi:hypothetical protein
MAVGLSQASASFGPASPGPSCPPVRSRLPHADGAPTPRPEAARAGSIFATEGIVWGDWRNRRFAEKLGTTEKFGSRRHGSGRMRGRTGEGENSK